MNLISNGHNGKFFQWFDFIVKVVDIGDVAQKSFEHECKVQTTLYDISKSQNWTFIPEIKTHFISDEKHQKNMKNEHPSSFISEKPLGIIIMSVRTQHNTFKPVDTCDNQGIPLMCAKILYNLWYNKPFQYTTVSTLNDFLITPIGQKTHIYLVEFGNINIIPVYEAAKGYDNFKMHLYTGKEPLDRWYALSPVTLNNSLKELKKEDYFTIMCKSRGSRSRGSSGSEKPKEKREETREDEKTKEDTIDDDEARTRLQYIAHGFQGKGIERALFLRSCVTYPNIDRTSKENKRCSRLIKKYPPGYFRYFHAWKSRGGRKRTTKRATKRTRRR